MGIFLNLLLTSSIKILFIGDSLTAGYGLREDQAYPALLEKFFKDDGIEVEVLNGGVSGDTTAGGLRRINWMLNNSQPDVCIIALGGNDMLRGLPTEKTKANIKEMISKIKASSALPIIFGIHAPENLGPRYVSSFNGLFRDLAQTEKVPLLDNYIEDIAGRPKLNLSDGIHPNETGQKMLAEKIYNFLKPKVIKLRKELK